MAEPRRWRWSTWAATVAVLGTAAQLRARVGQLAVLAPSDDPVDPDHLFLSAAGVSLDDATRRAASAHARAEGLAVLDLVPGDLDVERSVEVLRWTDPATYRTDRLALSRGPAHALLVHRDVARRAGLEPRPDLDPAELTLLAERAKKFAPTTSDLAIAPGLAARALDPAGRSRLLRAVLDFGARPYLASEGIVCALLGLGAVSAIRRRRPRRLLPLAAFSAQPLVAFAGTRLRPADLHRRTWARWPRRVAELSALGAHAVRDGTSHEELRETYDKLLAGGTEQFFEPRRPDCWFCGSADLTPVVDTEELLQCKPGRFVIERCGDCGHVFQNPRLTPEGLDFYYRDYYDGVGGRPVELLFGTQTSVFRARAEMVRGLAEPGAWIDVGADRGQFCLVAAEQWPGCRFDGLEQSDGIEEAERRGWVERGHRGFLPDLAPGLEARYDVVSMHHYLEHTRDPRAELDAAARLLRPGGHLLVEVPDPEFGLARLFGNLWGSYLPAQHLHLLPLGNLEQLLEERGFAVVRRVRGKAHVLGADFAWALYLVFQRLAPPTQFPWRPPAGRWARLKRTLLFGVVGPLLVVALGLDVLTAGVARVTNRSNAYRVVARKGPP